MPEQTYTPRAGSIAEASAAFLAGVGTWVDAMSLADTVECQPPSMIHASLSTAVTHGFFRKKTESGRCYYALASMVPAEPPAPAPVSVETPVQRVVPAESSKELVNLRQASAIEAVLAPPAEQPDTQPAGPVPFSPGQTGELVFGLFTDGRMSIEMGASRLLMDKAEVDRMVAFLRRVRLCL